MGVTPAAAALAALEASSVVAGGVELPTGTHLLPEVIVVFESISRRVHGPHFFPVHRRTLPDDRERGGAMAWDGSDPNSRKLLQRRRRGSRGRHP